MLGLMNIAKRSFDAAQDAVVGIRQPEKDIQVHVCSHSGLPMTMIAAVFRAHCYAIRQFDTYVHHLLV